MNKEELYQFLHDCKVIKKLDPEWWDELKRMTMASRTTSIFHNIAKSTL